MSRLEEAILKEGMHLFSLIKKHRDGFFTKSYWHNKMMDFAIKDPSFRLDLFHLVDVLPVLKSDEEVVSHVNEYLFKERHDSSVILKALLKTASLSTHTKMLPKLIKMNVLDMGKRFIIGQNLPEAKKNLLALYKQGLVSTVDLLGEATLSEKEADLYFERYKELINYLSNNVEDPNVSIKITALSSKLKKESPKTSVEELKKRVVPLLLLAKEKKVFVNFDIESFALLEISYELFYDLIMSNDFKNWPLLGVVVQAYLVNAKEILEGLIGVCKRGAPITIRLVKGAYWDYEVQYSKMYGLNCPVNQEKAATDYNYEALSEILLNNTDIVRPAFASHNIRSLAHVLSLAKEKNVAKSKFEIQMLYGMGKEMSLAFLKEGYNVRIYAPIGEMILGMAYLVRRLLENTSQSGFLRMHNFENVDKMELLKAPKPKNESHITKSAGFHNESFLDFTNENIRKSFTKSLDEIEKILPILIPIVIDGQRYEATNQYEHFRAFDKKKTSVLNLSGVKEAKKAVDAAFNAFSHFQETSLDERRTHLDNLANILLNDRFIMAAIIAHETSKTWAEADADVVEAIDFCRFYSFRAQEELNPKKLGSLMGEENFLYFNGRGPSLIIAPWNFPLAILCGMSVSSYVAGNPIIMKPSERSSAVAYYLYERMIKAGFLPTAVQFIPGKGSEIGPFLVEHEKVANICFTGSEEVGQDIAKRAALAKKDQIQVKKVILEMGGKNAVIIDNDADLDEAIKGILHSAFSYAGQKCSALSRLLVLDGIKDNLIPRLKEAASSLSIGDPIDPKNFMGPVIDERAQNNLLKKLERLVGDPAIKVIYKSKDIAQGFFVPITIIEVSDPEHWLMKEELFGPILTIFYCKDLDEAIKTANNSRFALTGGLYSRSPKNIEKVSCLFNVGNLYVNQKCTGAMVGRQPFGGFKMSGTGIKSGGPNHLLNLVDQKVVTINTMRQGFVPDLLS